MTMLRRAPLLLGLVLCTLSPASAQHTTLAAVQRNSWYLPTTDGAARLFVTEIGRGPPIVFLHGGPGNDFQYILDAIEPHVATNRFILFDDRGSLLSPVRPDRRGTLSLAKLVEDLELLRNSLHLDRMTLFGHSFGSLLALSYYQAHPNRVERLILTGSFPPTTTMSTLIASMRPRQAALRARPEVAATLEREHLNGAVETLSPRQVSDRSRIQGLAAISVIDLRRWRRAVGGGVFYDGEVDSAIGSTIPPSIDFRPTIRTHPVPISVIQGDRDYLDPGASTWRGFAASEPALPIKVTVIAAASHNPWIDNPQEYARAFRAAEEDRRWRRGGPPGKAGATQSTVSPRRPERDAMRRVIANWIDRAGVALAGTDPRQPLDDLAPLAAKIGDAHIVALGEASHGAREIFQVKDRLVRFLVDHMGFRVLALELDLDSVRKIDAYVAGRSTDTQFTLKPWDTEEFITLIEWVRRHNASVAPADRVRVVGIDGQDRVAGNKQLLAYIERVAPERAAAARRLFANETFPLRLDESQAAALQAQYLDLLSAFEFEGARFIAASSRAEFDQMHQLIRVMAQTGSMYGLPVTGTESLRRRDAYMADNMRRLVEQMPRETKIILWAHNGHVQVQPSSDARVPMGSFLRALYGQDYYVIGTSFLKGSYQAWDFRGRRPGEQPTLDDHDAKPLLSNSVESAFGDAKARVFFVDFRSTPVDAGVAEWLAVPRPHRSLGAGYSPDYSDVITISPSGAFDAEVFLRMVTPARPTARMRAKFARATDSGRGLR